MAEHTTRVVDKVTGTETTGHEWDGIRELNTPLPRWWLWTFYMTIIWSIGYWIVYPTWPLVSSYTSGLLGWQSRQAIIDDLAALKTQRASMVDRIAETPLQEILSDQTLIDFARAQGRTAFADNCAPCHGAGGGGAKGYPNLNDDDWLWGGKLDDIAFTIRHGVRSNDADTRMGSMPAFGRDKILSRPDILAVTDYVRSLSSLAVPANANLAVGKKVFADNCAACHGDAGKGNREIGAPDLTDQIWLYGSDRNTIIEGLMNGRGAVMPAWGQRLDDTTIKSLTVYVHTLGGGQK
ncbi:cytochrome-c oxidase, cbb3-type subunit III [Pseudorhodoplanes sinuspersici]|uniref:Cbb3-type cytochrome c oxidase subunit n=1 Tax=Pseudorhodoplanes sinuspersici TaxID=1235591 RepID=A0A1W6ZT45_9HYPH|nr:cytochrome-c oxidase, cbb3-type subunit III [Pseudorhodoplanes sinuspersici]ARQ00530.1 cytochrome-c oxidase, cbb3-type subunit III [Pseudorhodoplanes sinuspersici]RKE67279.1 cytochrome c oxidase cbb3-type subunit 3 [Pseudorhodoplanes sinuspersici]